MTVKLSIAMATYNGELYIRQQLDSFVSQTNHPYELVVCDDCSSDQTVDIINHFALTAPFKVRVFVNEKNLGFANNFLKAAKYCKGNWIAFSDQDDVWLPDKLSSVSRIIEKNKNDNLMMVCHMADVVDQKLSPIGRKLPLIKKNEIREKNSHYGFWCIGGCVMIFNADLISQVDSDLRPKDNYIAEGESSPCPWLPHDKWVCMLANAMGKTAYLNETLSLYRRHSSTLTGSHEEPNIFRKIKKASNADSSYQFLSNAALEAAISF